MKIRTFALQLVTASILSLSLLPSTATALDPEKQPIYSNIQNGSLCGTTFINTPVPCTVPARHRLIIEHVSGYAFQPASTDTTLAVSLVITDPGLGLAGAAFHTFVATRTSASGPTDVFSFSTPFRMMLNPGATFHFSPADNVAVSGYLVKQ